MIHISTDSENPKQTPNQAKDIPSQSERDFGVESENSMLSFNTAKKSQDQTSCNSYSTSNPSKYISKRKVWKEDIELREKYCQKCKCL